MAGGGGKGAYQIGVWEALVELKITKNITHFSGTSVGALNAALFTQGKAKQYREVWERIRASDVLDYMNKIKNPLIDTFAESDGIGDALVTVLHSFISDETSPGLFSRKNLKTIMEEELSFTKIKSSKKETYACCYNKERLRAEYFKLQDLSKKEIVQALLASSAIPGVFTSEKIGDYEYLDGGIADNVPFSPLLDKGLEKIIVVHLSKLSRYIHLFHRHSNIDFVHIAPSRDLGGPISGVLNFSADNISNLMEIGYSDALKVCKKLLPPT